VPAPVEADAVSVGDEVTCALLIGEVGVGAVTFNVEPSAADDVETVGAGGAVGAAVRLHATASATALSAAGIHKARDEKF
jgi:hypothetical protein